MYLNMNSQSKSFSQFSCAHPSIAMIPPSGVTGPNTLALLPTINTWYRLQRVTYIALLKTRSMILLEKMNPPRAMAGPAKR